MLKIAEYNKITGNKIDLKELEKFGFKSKNNFYMIKEFPTDFNKGGNKNALLVYYSNRALVMDIMNNDYTYHVFDDELGRIEETLFDLIKADLVEKVESDV